MKKLDFSKVFGEIDSEYIREAEGEWKSRKNVRTPLLRSRLAAACVILALISVVLANPKVQAAIREFVLSIGETLGFQKGIESYTEMLNTSRTDQGITVTLKEAVLDDGVLLYELHAQQDDSEKKDKSALTIDGKEIIFSLDSDKTTINGQKLDVYGNGSYLPYSIDDILDDEDIYENGYDTVEENRFYTPTELGDNPEVHLVIKASNIDDWKMKSLAEFSFDFKISRKEIRRQTVHKELKNISIHTKEGDVVLKNFSANKLQSVISAEIPEKLFQNYDIELRGTDSRGNTVNYELSGDLRDDGTQWCFKTNFWNTDISDENEDTQILKIPDSDSEYLELQLYLRSSDDAGWEAVGDKMRIEVK